MEPCDKARLSVVWTRFAIKRDYERRPKADEVDFTPSKDVAGVSMGVGKRPVAPGRKRGPRFV